LLKRLAIVKEVNKDTSSGMMIATVETSDGETVHVRTSADIHQGDVIEVESNIRGNTVMPVNFFNVQKVHSPKYGFTNKQPSANGDPFYVPEIADGKTFGEISRGHCSASASGIMTGYGITNYTYYDDTTKYSKALNRVGIEGNKVYGESLTKGLSACFYLSSLDTQKYLEMPMKDLQKALKVSFYDISYLIDLIGVHGFLYLISSTIYKIEGSGHNSFSKFLAIRDINITDSDTIYSTLEPLRAYISNYVDLSTVIDYQISLYPDEGQTTQKSDGLAVDLKIRLFNKDYMVNAITLSHRDGIFQYSRNMQQNSNQYSFDTDKVKLVTNDIKIPKPFYLNADTNQLTIINEKQLRFSIKDIKFSVNQLEILGTSKIILQVDKKGMLIDMTGTSHIG